MDTRSSDAFAVVKSMLPNNHSASAHEKYKCIVKTIAANRSLLEIGAGRRPLMTAAEIKEFKINYTANDYAESELNLIQFPVNQAVFDACGDLPVNYFNKFDVICSKMVQEHVKSGKIFYSNIFNLLRCGGIAINFHPTLFCPPFLINRMLPTQISDTILSSLSSDRNESNIPKFPAAYEFCYSLPRIETLIKEVGFSSVAIIPFYHHEYFKAFPVIRWIDDKISFWARTHDIRFFSSYAYTLVQK